ncbi:MAG: HAD-IA family hydrolase [Leptospiraceae bacterium]|nr:HAD-IA family hydrolase [Leptospiraceae bacterium]
MKKFVFIDVGDTLLHLKRSPNQIYYSVFKKHRLIPDSITEDIAEKILWNAWRELSKPDDEFRDRYYHHPRGNNGWWIDLISRYLNDIHSNNKVQPNEESIQEIFYEFDNPDVWHLDESFFELEIFLRSNQIGLGIISNWDNRLKKLLEKKNLLRYFRHVIVSAEFGYEKPSPKIFQEAERLTSVSGKDLLYIGDKLDLDILPTRNLSWKSLHIVKTKINSEYEITKLSDAINIINQEFLV